MSLRNGLLGSWASRRTPCSAGSEKQQGVQGLLAWRGWDLAARLWEGTGGGGLLAQ